MGKLKQKNWLLIITIFLVVSSVIALSISMRKSLGFGTCAYDKEIYLSGQQIPNYNGRSDCYCSREGKVQCNTDETLISFEDYSSSGLKYFSSFLNYLEKESVSSDYVQAVDVGYTQGVLSVVIEREAMCGDEQETPIQVGFYKLAENDLTLTVLTNRDPSFYNRVCKIDGKFVLEKEGLSLKEDFKLYFQNDLGKIFDLGVCVYNGKLYGNGDVLQSVEGDKACSCNSGVVECN